MFFGYNLLLLAIFAIYCHTNRGISSRKILGQETTQYGDLKKIQKNYFFFRTRTNEAIMRTRIKAQLRIRKTHPESLIAAPAAG